MLGSRLSKIQNCLVTEERRSRNARHVKIKHGFLGALVKSVSGLGSRFLRNDDLTRPGPRSRQFSAFVHVARSVVRCSALLPAVVHVACCCSVVRALLCAVACCCLVLCARCLLLLGRSCVAPRCCLLLLSPACTVCSAQHISVAICSQSKV